MAAYLSLDPQTLCRDALGKPQAIILQPDTRRQALELESWRILPTSERDMFACVKARKDMSPEDKSRPVTVLFRTPPGHNQIKFAVSVVGYLDSGELGPFGNWKRDGLDSCPGAAIVLALGPGIEDNHGSWVAQLRGLNHLRQAISEHIRGFNLTPKNKSYRPGLLDEAEYCTQYRRGRSH